MGQTKTGHWEPFTFDFSLYDGCEYVQAPFHPNRHFPEFGSLIGMFDEHNIIYEQVRELFLNAGYDKENIGTDRWNPFRNLVTDGQVVVIKPNLVLEERDHFIGSNCTYTNGNIIRPVVDYLCLLQKTDQIRFKIIICDVPLQGADFDILTKQNGLQELIAFVNNNFGSNVELLDLRKEIAVTKNGFIRNIILNNGDPRGYVIVHLKESFLNEIIKDYRKFSIGDYNTKNTKNKHKNKADHFYEIPRTILLSDLFINIPKIKTHAKAGVTIAMKNLIGINGDKSYVPHHRTGAKKFGGDEFSDENFLFKYITTIYRRKIQGKSRILWEFGRSVNKVIKNLFFKNQSLDHVNRENKFSCDYYKLVDDGGWYGNDTIWRPILDLNYLLYYADKDGKITQQKMRNFLILADGIISGEGYGPLKCQPKKAGLVTLSRNPVIHDICCSDLMGFDWEKIPVLRNSVSLSSIFGFNGDLSDIDITGDLNHVVKHYSFSNLPNLGFLPSPGWLKHIEK